MINDEAVVWEVFVEGVNDPIAIEPDFAWFVFFVAVGIGVVSRVEPVASPTFAVVRGREELIDDLREGIRRSVGNENLSLLGTGWEAHDIEGHPAQERAPVGVWRRPEAFLLQLRENEAIDRRAPPRSILNGRRRR